MSKKLDTIKLELGIDPQIILEKIDYIAKNCNTTYSDAILHYCKTSNTEIEVVAELIKSSPKMKASGGTSDRVPKKAGSDKFC
jgi:hypothetical protein